MYGINKRLSAPCSNINILILINCPSNNAKLKCLKILSLYKSNSGLFLRLVNVVFKFGGDRRKCAKT